LLRLWLPWLPPRPWQAWQRESLAVPSRRCGGPSVWAKLGGLGRSVVQGCVLAPCPFHHTPMLDNPGTSQKPLPRRDSKRDGPHGAGKPERKDSQGQPGKPADGTDAPDVSAQGVKVPVGVCAAAVHFPSLPNCEPQSRLGKGLQAQLGAPPKISMLSLFPFIPRRTLRPPPSGLSQP
jgi:hypothetical protein